MRLTAIGTSGSFPGPGAAASCYLVEVDDRGRRWRVVLDLGSGALGQLQEACAIGDIDAVLLSHLHPDHCLDMTGLYVARSYDPRRPAGEPARRIPVWAPPGADARLTAAYHTEPGCSPVDGEFHHTDLASIFDFHDIAPGLSFEVGPLQVSAYLVDHPVEAYALRLSTPDGAVLAYSGDSDECDALVAAASGADLFLCEAAFQDGRDTARGVHLTGSRAGASAQRAGVRALVLTHIPPWTDAAQAVADAAGAYDGPVEIARPMGSWTLGAAF